MFTINTALLHPPFRNATGGASAARSSGPQPSLSPVTLGPRPGLDHLRCRPPPPPACVEPCPPHHVTTSRHRSSSSSPRPGILQASLPPPNNADDQRSDEATREPSPEDDKPWQPSLWRGEGCRTQCPVAPGIAQLISQDLSTVVSLLSSSSLGARRGGGAPAAAVAGRRGSDGRGSGGSDNDMFCCGCGRSYVVFLVWWRCEIHWA